LRRGDGASKVVVSILLSWRRSMDPKTFARMAGMKRLPLSLVAYATSFAALAALGVRCEGVALACPGYASNASSCGASAGYLSAIGLGVAIGIGSSALEAIFQKKR
jgi:hypothetical protein